MAFVLLVAPLLVQATGHDVGSTPGSDTGSTPGGLNNPLEFGSINEFFVAFLDVIVQVAFPLVVIAVVYTGFLFVTAQGDVTKLETAKKAFLWTVVGALIVLGAAAISELVCGTVEEIRGVSNRC